MLRLSHSEVLDLNWSFVAWSLGMRSNQFSNCTQRESEQKTLGLLWGRNSGCGKAITGGGICNWCELLGKTGMWGYRKKVPESAKMPAISFHWRREVHRWVSQLRPRGRLRGCMVGQGEPWHRAGSTLRGCVTRSESLHLSEPLFLHTQN